MQYFTDINHPLVARLLTNGHIGVLRTDTLYGIVASARHKAAVERLYAVRNREETKPCILLIGSESDMFDAPTTSQAAMLRRYWPGPVSIILPAPQAPTYLTRGGQTLAYRLPADEHLQTLLQTISPLLAPSANLAGQPPATTMAEAEAYFGDAVDFYVDGGKATSEPSQLLRIGEDGAVERLR